MRMNILTIGGGTPQNSEKGGKALFSKSCLHDLRERRSEALRGGDPRG